MIRFKRHNDTEMLMDTLGDCWVSVDNTEYQDWLSAGNTPDPADVIDPMIAVRAKRDQLLIQADIEFNKLDDKGLSTTKIKADRVALRDLPTSQPTATIDTVDWTFLKVLKV